VVRIGSSAARSEYAATRGGDGRAASWLRAANAAREAESQCVRAIEQRALERGVSGARALG